jgi:hypothetical protein
MDKNKFCETKTIISPDGKTVTTINVCGSSTGEASTTSSSITTSVTTTISTDGKSNTTVTKSE